MNAEEMKRKVSEAKALHLLEKAYDIKAYQKRLKEVGLDVAEDAVGLLYFTSKEFVKDSAPLSNTKIDDAVAPFLDHGDQFIIPQIDKIDGKENI